MSPLTTSPETYTPAVAQGLDELRAIHGELEALPDGQGGALVTIATVVLPRELRPKTSWSGFIIPSTYDSVQVYGHHFLPELARADGQTLGINGGVTAGTWLGQPSICVSRESKRWRPGVDTAALKLRKVLDWLAS